MSIKPEYAEAIFNGSKTVELRRKRPSFQPGTNIVVYASSPSQQVQGTFVAGRVEALAPNALWRHVGGTAGVTKDTFDAYFSGCEVGYAIHVVNPKRVPRARRLRIRPPQSYLFLRRERQGHQALLRVAAAAC